MRQALPRERRSDHHSRAENQEQAESAARGGGGRYGESREEIWTAEGAQRGRGIKNKGPGQGSCVASQARRQEDARTMGGDPGESRESGAKVQAGGQSQDPTHDLPGLWVGARSAEGTLEGLDLFFHF